MMSYSLMICETSDYSITLQLMVKDSKICSYEMSKNKDRKKRKKKDWKMKIAFEEDRSH